MRLWHYKLLPYLPDAQFKGQLRELVAIMNDWRDKGETNHLLINRVMEYDKVHLTIYFLRYRQQYQIRYGKDIDQKLIIEFLQFSDYQLGMDFKIDPVTGKFVSVRLETDIFPGWHNKEYLRVCMANLYEKNRFGIGRSHIPDGEWKRLCDGYKAITGEDYSI